MSTIDYNPDHQRSSSALFIEDRGTDIVWILQVKGLGVIVMRAATSWRGDGKMEFRGVSTFSKAEIGYAPSM